MKHLTRILAVSLSIGTASIVAHAAPFLAIGDGAEVFFTGVAGVRNDSNITFAPDHEKSDTIWSLAPGLQLTFGTASELKGSLSLAENFDIYSKYTSYNTDLFSGDFVSNYDDDKLKFNFDTFYHQLNQNNASIRNLTRRNEFNLTTGAEVNVADKESVGGSFEADNTQYQSSAYSSSTTYSVPLNLYYHWTPKVDLSAGYRYRDTQEDLGADSQDNYFNVGARGEFTPKLSGSFDVGYESVDYSKTTSTPKTTKGNLGFDANLVYTIDPKTTFNLTGSNSYGNDALGNTQKTLSVGVGATTQILDELSGNASFTVQANQYDHRTDDFYDAEVGVSYMLNTHVSFTASYEYRNNTSDASGIYADEKDPFTDNVFSISAKLRY